MSQSASTALSLLYRAVTNTGTGVNSELAQAITSGGRQITLLEATQIKTTNIASDLAERTGAGSYPGLHLYCDRLSNSLEEKFRIFSGKVQLVVEVRTTHDQADGLMAETYSYVDAVTAVLERSRGRWSEEVFYPGTYEVIYGAIRSGGKNYVQVTKVQLPVNVSI